MKKFLACVGVLLAYSSALAIPLDSWPTWSTAQPYISKSVPPQALVMRGIGTSQYYIPEIDVTTGEIPVSLAGASISIDYSGATGAAVPADAAYIGGVDPGGLLRGLSVTTGGVLNVTNGNLPTTVSTNVGAADSSTIRVTEGSRAYSDSARYDYSGGSVTTGAWTQVLASTAAATNYICITDQSGQIMELGTGAAASETRVFLIARGFSGCIPLRIAASTRLSVRAVSATASTGDLVLSGLN